MFQQNISAPKNSDDFNAFFQSCLNSAVEISKLEYTAEIQISSRDLLFLKPLLTGVEYDLERLLGMVSHALESNFENHEHEYYSKQRIGYMLSGLLFVDNVYKTGSDILRYMFPKDNIYDFIMSSLGFGNIKYLLDSYKPRRIDIRKFEYDWQFCLDVYSPELVRFMTAIDYLKANEIKIAPNIVSETILKHLPEIMNTKTFLLRAPINNREKNRMAGHFLESQHAIQVTWPDSAKIEREYLKL